MSASFADTHTHHHLPVRPPPRPRAPQNLLRAEMVHRAAKSVLRQHLQAASRTARATVVAHFVNCFLAYTPCAPWAQARSAVTATSSAAPAKAAAPSAPAKQAPKHKGKG